MTKPISVKVRGDDLQQIKTATIALKEILEDIPAVQDITDDSSKGRNELNFSFR